MDYVYGQLNEKVQKALYTGSETQTATTTVDNASMIISVNVLGLAQMQSAIADLQQRVQALENNAK